jgi:hypothetical protein
MCDEGMAISTSMGEGAIDVARSMRKIQRAVRRAAAESKDPNDRPSLHVSDGVHLNDLGQLAMAVAILKGLGAPAEVSSAVVDAESGAASGTGCKVASVHVSARHVEFDRRDSGLPLNLGVFGALQYRFVPIPDELDRYVLTVAHLAPGRYEVLAENRSLGAFSADQLAAGVNICSSTADGWQPGGPWDAEAGALARVTDARYDLLEAGRQVNAYLPAHPAERALQSASRTANDRLEAIQRELVRPRPFHFEVRPEVAAAAGTAR